MDVDRNQRIGIQRPTQRRTLRRCALAALAFSVLGATTGIARAQAPCSYEVAAIIQAPPGPIHDSITRAMAISPSGEYVVGYFKFDALGEDRAFVYHVPSAEFRALPLVAGTFASRAMDVNDAGMVVGFIGGEAGDFGFVFDLASDQQTLLPPIDPLGTCSATGINAGNVVCGHRSIGSKTDPVNPFTAFIWSENDGFTDLGLVDGQSTGAVDIADDGAVAVVLGVGLGGYRWHADELTSIGLIKGADGLSPAAIASGGRIVGGFPFIEQGVGFWGVPFDFNNDVLSLLPPLNSSNGNCHTRDVNSNDMILGNCAPIGQSPPLWIPVIWHNGTATNVKALTEPVSGLILGAARGISDDGVIVCNGRIPALNDLVAVLTPILRIEGDVNCDKIIDHDDLLAVIVDWGKTQSPADLNLDHIVNAADLLTVIFNWTFDA